MTSENKNVSSFILKESEKAIVTHYTMHNLNLSISSAAIVQHESITFFFNLSLKRENLLKYIVDVKCVKSNRKN